MNGRDATPKSDGSDVCIDSVRFLERLKAREGVAWTILVGDLNSKLRSFAGRLQAGEDSSDIVQEVFCWLWNNLDSFDPSLSKLSTFLYNSVRYRVQNDRRQMVVRGRMVSLGESVMVASDAAAADETEFDEDGLSDVFNEIVAELPERDRELLPCIWDETVRDAVAVELNVSRDTLRQQIHRLKRKLKRLLGERGVNGQNQ